MSEIRVAVRRLLDSEQAARYRGKPLVVACSGGPDSLALAAAAVYVGRHRHVPVRAVVVDHGLQEGSEAVASRAAEQLGGLGCSGVETVRVTPRGGGGPEAAARRARYEALRRCRPEGSPVLLGHTRDDQAETVLLGLGRGSGPRSVAGMRPVDPPWLRPLLEVSRRTTEAVCAELGLSPWRDPHNTDSRFTRVRLRTEVLPLMEDVLQGGVASALSRTAAQLREDADALDALAEELRARVRTPEGLDAQALASNPPSLRRRVLRDWLRACGVPELSDAHLREADALVGDWRGQGGHALPGGFELIRVRGTLLVECGGRRIEERASDG
ncbi:tRNA lysidine(34) synthetase TilS [Actinopolyspora mortivallis]|uniref:tRNA lysidine(34) synthetase TilS n=1 Tax=Actinopolyspora mortivallis TaxID=33906 RepID=UPI000364194D|nr:tRNA lysidine(34) synthetase TilS [Actinopolyspora mortivallis]